MLHNRRCSTSSGLSGKHHYLNAVTCWTTCHPIAVKIDGDGNSHLPTVHRPLPCLRNLSLVFTSIMHLSFFSKHFFPHCVCFFRVLELKHSSPLHEKPVWLFAILSSTTRSWINISWGNFWLLHLHNTYSWPEQSEEKECGSAMHPREKPFICFKIDKVTKARRVRAHFKPFNKFKHSKSIFQKNPLSFFWSCANKNLLVKNASHQTT